MAACFSIRGYAMNIKQPRLIAFAVLLLIMALFVSACSDPQDVTGATPTPEATPNATATPEATATPDPKNTITVDGYRCELAFEDEFEGDDLNFGLWNYCPAWERQDLGNRWDWHQVKVEDGKLKLSMSCEDGVYKSGAIRTINTYKQQYGYFEICCQLNQIPGYWCAFWLYGTGVSNANGSAEDGTEIDIFESPYYNRSEIGHAIHYDDDSWQGGHSIYSKSTHTYVEDIYSGYHTFSLLWTPDKYVFYIDGETVWTLTEEDIPGGICQVPLYMKVTVETGSWTGLPDADALPDAFLVEYVRAYTLIQE